MSVRLNITMDDDVYERLKKEVPPKKLSAFISGAVRAKLHPDTKTLDAAYRAASKEQWRTGLAEDWRHIDDEGWIARGRLLAASDSTATPSRKLPPTNLD